MKFLLLVCGLLPALAGCLNARPTSSIASSAEVNVPVPTVTVSPAFVCRQSDLPDAVQLQQCIDQHDDVALPQGSQWLLAQTVTINRSGVRLHTQAGGQLTSDVLCGTLPQKGKSPVIDPLCATLRAAPSLRFVDDLPANVPGSNTIVYDWRDPAHAPGADYNWTPQVRFLGMFTIDAGDVELNHVQVSQLVLDGNGDARHAYNPFVCDNDSVSGCANIVMFNCRDCAFEKSVSMHAPGGWDGVMGGTAYLNSFIDVPGLSLRDNLFWRNGQAFYSPTDGWEKNFWLSATAPAATGRGAGFGYAGLTLLVRASAKDVTGLNVVGNNLVDVSDGGMCFEVRAKRLITGLVGANQILQYEYYENSGAICLQSIAPGNGIGQDSDGQIGSFGKGSSLDPAQTLVVRENTIDCDASADSAVAAHAKKCIFGIELGSHPWLPGTDPSAASTFGGAAILNNRVADARIGINVGGTGTPDNPTYILGNLVDSDDLFSASAPGESFNADVGATGRGYSADYYFTNLASPLDVTWCLYGSLATLDSCGRSTALFAGTNAIPNWGLHRGISWWTATLTAGHVFDAWDPMPAPRP